MGITPRKMWDFADWGVKYEIGTFYDNAKLSESGKCEKSKIFDGNTWFVKDDVHKLKDVYNEEDAVKIKQRHIDNIWHEINSDKYSELDENLKLQALMSLECLYNKQNLVTKGASGCVVDGESDNIETCADLGITDIDELENGLEDMLEFEGVKNNECLQNIRKTVWNSAFTEKEQLLNLCNGEYDMFCPELPKEFISLSMKDENEGQLETFTADNKEITLKMSVHQISVLAMIGGASCIVFVLVSVLMFFCYKKWKRSKAESAVQDDIKFHQDLYLPLKFEEVEENNYGTTL